MPHPPVIRFSYASRFLSGCMVSHMIHLHVLFFTEKRLFYSHIKYITLDDALSSIFRKDVNFFFADVVLKRNCSRRDRVSGNTFGTAFSIHFALNI